MSKKAGTALSVMAMVFMGALASPLTVLAADAEETYQPALYATIWALLPPLVAIVLAPVSYTHLSGLLLLRKTFRRAPYGWKGRIHPEQVRSGAHLFLCLLYTSRCV